MTACKLPLEKSCSIIKQHPDGLLAIEKAPGILTHPNPKESNSRSILKCPFDYENECYVLGKEKGTGQNLFLVHRIDSATSGVLIASTCPQLAIQLKKAFAKRLVEKTYFAIVNYHGTPIRSPWKDCLQKTLVRGKIRVISSNSGVTATTLVKIQQKTQNQYGGLALLKLMPQTGRTHQLRVQCSKRRLPILGDRTYGQFNLNRKITKLSKINRLFLHSAKLKVELTLRDQTQITWEAESSLPTDFRKILE